MLSKIFNTLRERYFECERLSQKLGLLISLDYENNQENIDKLR